MSNSPVITVVSSNGLMNGLTSGSGPASGLMKEQNVIVMPQTESVTALARNNKLILLLMIKNESRIIKRCIESALPHVDAISVLDTGSTDATVVIAETYLATCGKPYKITVDPFKNFGKSRTISFERAAEFCTELGWDAGKTYTMAVDADMVLKIGAGFKDFPLTANGYSIIQANGHLNYHNTRIMRCGYPWKCVGATHEYWSGEGVEKIPVELITIDDKNDGGCKHDKFERDIRLLTEEIVENPKNDRAHYYLGQSLKDTGKFNEAIEMFKKRIELGGWVEEVHYAHYQIGRCYDHLGMPTEMEFWMNKAFDFYPKKAEPIYHLTRYFREKSQHFKAFQYYLKGRNIPYPKDDLLFIENAVYTGLFDYEATVIDCYVTQRNKIDALTDITSYINRGIQYHLHNVWDNYVYYVEPLVSATYRGTASRILVRDHEEYKASSLSMIPFQTAAGDMTKKFIVNARLVNYSIDSQGAYHMRSADGHVKTKNARIYMNAAYQVTEDAVVLTENYEKFDRNIEGLEDVRLFWHNKQLKCIASSKNATDDERIVLVCGDYSAESATISNTVVLESPTNSFVEKNWVYVPTDAVSKEHKDKMNFIYGWRPLLVGAVNAENKLVIHTQYDTPVIFQNARGSTALTEYDGKLWCVVHFVKYATPRIYYHSLVQLNKDTLKMEKFSLPFYFKRMAIEYCLGMHIDGASAAGGPVASMLFSENDTAPGLLQVPVGNLRWISI